MSAEVSSQDELLPAGCSSSSGGSSSARRASMRGIVQRTNSGEGGGERQRDRERVSNFTFNRVFVSTS